MEGHANRKKIQYLKRLVEEFERFIQYMIHGPALFPPPDHGDIFLV